MSFLPFLSRCKPAPPPPGSAVHSLGAVISEERGEEPGEAVMSMKPKIKKLPPEIKTRD